jgi:hypothetical protein
MSDDFIAMRNLGLAGETPGEVTVGIKRPVPDDGPYKCEYQIVGMGSGKVRYAMGEDSMQALVLALQTIGADLYTSEAAKEGRLTWFGSRNLGFPVPDGLADLVPKDSHPIGMLFDFRYAPDNWHRTIECADWANAREAATGAASRLNAEWVEIYNFDGVMETWRYIEGQWKQVSTAKGPPREPQIVHLPRGDIPRQYSQIQVVVDIRPMTKSDHGSREEDGVFYFYADSQGAEDIKEATHRATLLAKDRGIHVVYIWGPDARSPR